MCASLAKPSSRTAQLEKYSLQAGFLFFPMSPHLKKSLRRYKNTYKSPLT